LKRFEHPPRRRPVNTSAIICPQHRKTRILAQMQEDDARGARRSAAQQYGAKVHYKHLLVGEYFVGLLINDVLLVELKTVKALDDAHRMQCTNYLKATGRQLCLLFNLSKPRLEIKRVANGL
jgi:GxxExxY protein